MMALTRLVVFCCVIILQLINDNNCILCFVPLSLSFLFLSQARQIFSQVVSIDPECSEAVSHLAEMYRRQKKFTEAIQTYINSDMT